MKCTVTRAVGESYRIEILQRYHQPDLVTDKMWDGKEKKINDTLASFLGLAGFAVIKTSNTRQKDRNKGFGCCFYSGHGSGVGACVGRGAEERMTVTTAHIN